MPTFKTTTNDVIVLPWRTVLPWVLLLLLGATGLGLGVLHVWNDHDLLHALPGAFQQQAQKLNELEKRLGGPAPTPATP